MITREVNFSSPFVRELTNLFFSMGFIYMIIDRGVYEIVYDCWSIKSFAYLFSPFHGERRHPYVPTFKILFLSLSKHVFLFVFKLISKKFRLASQNISCHTQTPCIRAYSTNPVFLKLLLIQMIIISTKKVVQPNTLQRQHFTEHQKLDLYQCVRAEHVRHAELARIHYKIRSFWVINVSMYQFEVRYRNDLYWQ